MFREIAGCFLALVLFESGANPGVWLLLTRSHQPKGEAGQDYSLLKEMFEGVCPTLKLVAFLFHSYESVSFDFLFYCDPFLHQNIS